MWIYLDFLQFIIHKFRFGYLHGNIVFFYYILQKFKGHFNQGAFSPAKPFAAAMTIIS